MTTPTPKPNGNRRITITVSAELYASLTVAKTYFRKSLTDLTREGLELVAQRYRNQRLAERAASQTENQSPKPEGEAS